ncbi:MAG TPA: aminopeptidase family protein P, partial [Paracoccaceae bacterium]|nr:aminopeptidase family protein P [Paracoccaceae bacterium]
TSVYTPVHYPETGMAEWLLQQGVGGKIGFDPWLHTAKEIQELNEALEGSVLDLCPVENPIDRIWHDRPPLPSGKVLIHPDSLAGETSQAKRHRLGEAIAAEGLDAAMLTLPDSIAWLLNIRGTDIERTPVALAFALLHTDGRVDLFIEPEKLDQATRDHLGRQVDVHATDQLLGALGVHAGKIGLDYATAPQAILDALHEPVDFADPCILPKARKNDTELAGMRAAHVRDGAAMTRFLHWLAEHAPRDELTEIDVVKKLEGFRRDTNMLHDISFETICGAGPNGAIVHYRVTEDTNRPIRMGDILLVDSGAQYPDGTTDITRTIAIGPAEPAAIRANTLVLKGMIAISTARFPKGIAGRDIDGFARRALWLAGLDYDHGTGHGVGAFLDVHERPQRISRAGTVPLETGMIVSNEPGYYREGAFGIRIENLVAVTPASTPVGGEREMLGFETLTLAPIDRNLIDSTLLDASELSWLNAYHKQVADTLTPLLPEATATWLARVCQPL